MASASNLQPPRTLLPATEIWDVLKAAINEADPGLAKVLLEAAEVKVRRRGPFRRRLLALAHGAAAPPCSAPAALPVSSSAFIPSHRVRNGVMPTHPHSRP